MGFTRQPQTLAPLDSNNPITLGMLAGAIPHVRRDFVTGAAYTQEGTYAISISSAGIGLATNGSSSDIWLAIPPVVLTRFTLFGLFRSNSAAADTRALALGSSTDVNPILQIGTGATTASKVRVFARDNTTGGTASNESSTVAFDGTLHSIAITYDGANVNCYIDGKFDSSSAGAGLSFTVDRFCIGALRRATTASFWSGTTFLSAAWSRALSAAEINSLTITPWQLFKAPDRRTRFAPSTGGTNTPINPGVGAIALTNYSPAVAQSANQSLTPGPGSLTITAYAPSIAWSANQEVSPTGGILSIAGYAPNIRQPQGVAPLVGLITTTWHAPSVSQGLTTEIAPGVGSIRFTGYAPLVSQTVNQSVTPSSGVLSIAASAASLLQSDHQSLAPGSGAIVLTGLAPNVRQAGPADAVYPPASLVAVGVTYGPNGDDFTGSYAGGGLTDDQNAMLTALAKIHGLVPGSPLVVTQSTRSAGDVVQTITESAGIVTIARA